MTKRGYEKMMIGINRWKNTNEKQKTAFIITGGTSYSNIQTLFREGFQEEEDAKSFLLEMGCKNKGSFWEKDNIIYSINKIHIHNKFN